MTGAATEAERYGKRILEIGVDIGKNNEELHKQRKIVRSVSASSEEQAAARREVNRLTDKGNNLEECSENQLETFTKPNVSQTNYCRNAKTA